MGTGCSKLLALHQESNRDGAKYAELQLSQLEFLINAVWPLLPAAEAAPELASGLDALTRFRDNYRGHCLNQRQVRAAEVLN